MLRFLTSNDKAREWVDNMIGKDQLMSEDNRQSSLGMPQPPDEADPSLFVRPEVCSGTILGNERIRFVYPRKPTLRRICYSQHIIDPGTAKKN
jgi:hypothetical protein